MDGQPVDVYRLEHLAIDDREAFERHFEALSRLDHLDLVAYRRARTDESPVEIVAEAVDGTDFLTYVRSAPTVEELRTLRRRFTDEQSTDSVDDAPEVDPAEADPSSRPADDTTGESTETAESEETGDETSQLLAETPTPGSHSYSRGRLGDDDPGDVLLDPPDEYGAREVEFIDVVFLRLERLVPQILGALDYLHRFEQPHGALHPGHLVVEPGGRVRITHYGLLSSAELVRSSTDADGSIRPPPDDLLEYARAYQPPESRADFTPSAAGDLYALGCLLFEAITGCRPLDADGDDDVGADDDTERTTSVSQELEAVPASADEREESDAPDPDRRYALRASALSELEPRCPAAWTDIIVRLLDSAPDTRPGFDDIREALASSRRRSVDIPPTFIPEQDSLFGRDEIFTRLVDRAQQCVADDTLRVSLLAGAAGNGKTAMAQRLGQWAAQRGWVVLRGRCYEQESLLYQGWNDIAIQLGDICRRARGELDTQTAQLRRRAGRLFPTLAPDDSPTEEILRLDAVDALRQLFQVVAAERPVLLLIDDLNWANPDTLELFADFVGDPDDLPCFAVGTWRDDVAGYPAERLPEVLHNAPVDLDRVSIREFRRDEARAYLETIADIEPETRDRLLEVAGSNPLLLEELVYQLHLARDSDEADEADDSDASADLLLAQFESDDDEPAESSGELLTQLVDLRLDDLSRRETFVVQLLSIVSIPLPESIIASVVDREFHATDNPDDSIRSLLHRLRSDRLVLEVQSERWKRAYTLFHDLTRQIVLDELPVQHYTHLCDHLAQALARLWPEAEELRFEFALRADRDAEAVDSAIRTAREATDRFAHFRATKLWRWLAERDEDSSRLTSIQPRRELAEAEFRAGNVETAADLFGDLAEALPADIPAARRYGWEFAARLAAGDRPGAIEALESALAIIDDRYRRASLLRKVSEWKNRAVAATQRWSDDPESLRHDDLGGRQETRLLLYRGIIEKNDVLDSPHGTRFRAKFSALAERSRDALLIGYDRLFLARECHAYGINRHPDRAEEWYAQAGELFEAADERLGRALGALGRARLARHNGDFADADSCLARADAHLDGRAHSPLDEPYAPDVERGRIYRERGDFERSDTIARRVRHFYRNDALAQFRARQLDLPIALLRGNVSRAEMMVDEVDRFLEEGPTCIAEVWLARQRTRLNLARGRPEVARARLDVLYDDLRSTRLLGHPYVSFVFHLSHAQALLAEVSRKQALGEARRSELLDRIRRDVDQFRNTIATLSPPLAAEAHRLLARHDLTRDDYDSALDHIDSATDHLASYPNPIARSLCAEAQGYVLEAQDPDQGASLKEQARVIYDHHGCRFPLVLEGWPVPDRYSRLRPDADD